VKGVALIIQIGAEQHSHAHDETIQTAVAEYSAMLYRIAFHQLRSAADAEDAVQSTFVKWLERKAPFDSEDHQKAWLIRTVISRSRHLLDSAWFRRTVPLDTLPEDTAAPDPGNGVLDEVLRLPPKLRTAVYLYYYEGYKVKEISRILGVGEPTVQSRLRRAREKLKIELEDSL